MIPPTFHSPGRVKPDGLSDMSCGLFAPLNISGPTRLPEWWVQSHASASHLLFGLHNFFSPFLFPYKLYFEATGAVTPQTVQLSPDRWLFGSIGLALHSVSSRWPIWYADFGRAGVLIRKMLCDGLPRFDSTSLSFNRTFGDPATALIDAILRPRARGGEFEFPCVRSSRKQALSGHSYYHVSHVLALAEWLVLGGTSSCPTRTLRRGCGRTVWLWLDSL